ncbi:hypothetical protein [Nonomuraea sp. NEAU-A123]|uniref:hypothetical protein n=1 Tax=Nonomuraea sp. NEAU-A123 TaxID=2839649 RepID=UPI001BE4200D|nr:hypothetical protein [Nonomuraea sp. NEAU-A123]MBT2233246.1 hypothetical protein [Nonomuraea sp. NEAU-A123]
MIAPSPSATRTTSPSGAAVALTSVLAVVIWLAGFIAWLAVSILGDKACGLDALASYQSDDCDTVSTWGTVTLSTWLLAPIGCAVLLALLTAVPERYAGARQAALYAVPLVPLLVIVEAALAYAL